MAAGETAAALAESLGWVCRLGSKLPLSRMSEDMQAHIDMWYSYFDRIVFNQGTSNVAEMTQ